ncbi:MULTISPECIES: TadE/TadG family type IV pilus assembly protein [Pseudooceanicola]|uniref:TadE/TadG family type IV pilus assembly protein n=1 Tax=Pseudooceanicola TaxID=1679449 RepID=UPI0040585F57
MTHPIVSRLLVPFRRFRDETSGTVAIEAVILLPVLFWSYLAMFSYFDMLRQQSLNQKASYTIADMLSREQIEINDQYITNAHTLFTSMIRSDSTTAMRISILEWDGDRNRFEVQWSKARGPSSPMTAGAAQGLTRKLPVMPSGEQIILVETWTDYKIPFKIGMDDFGMNTFTFTRIRFGSHLCFSNNPDAVDCVEA